MEYFPEAATDNFSLPTQPCSMFLAYTKGESTISNHPKDSFSKDTGISQPIPTLLFGLNKSAYLLTNPSEV